MSNTIILPAGSPSESSEVQRCTMPERSLILAAIDATSLGSSQIHDLGVMFEAIQKASKEDDQTHKLAMIGYYLADEWGYELNDVRQKLEKAWRGES